jgi:hypothetical protein
MSPQVPVINKEPYTLLVYGDRYRRERLASHADSLCLRPMPTTLAVSRRESRPSAEAIENLACPGPRPVEAIFPFNALCLTASAVVVECSEWSIQPSTKHNDVTKAGLKSDTRLRPTEVLARIAETK